MKSEEHVGLRMPVELKQRLSDAANAAGRTLSEEMKTRLEQTFAEVSGLPSVKQVLSALDEAARMAEFTGQFVGGEPMGDQALEAAAYALFELAASVLIEAGRPEGYEPLSIRNEWVGTVVMSGTAQPDRPEGIPAPKVAAVLKRKLGESDAR